MRRTILWCSILLLLAVSMAITGCKQTSNSVASSSIVGSYGDGVTGSKVFSLTFYPDGKYMYYQNGDANCPTCIGVEYGTYTYDSGTTTLTVTPTVDENGEIGLSHPSDVGKSLSYHPVTVNGVVFSIYISEDGVTRTASRVVDANNPIVGSWDRGIIESYVVAPDDKGYLTFYANGTYIEWEDADTYCSTPATGVEYGTYSYNAGTQTLTATSTVDENGDCGGITIVAGQANSIAGISVNGDVMTIEYANGKKDTFNRVQ